MAIFSRSHPDMTDMFNLPARSFIREVKGEWALLVDEPQNVYDISYILTYSK
jgi:hypothetical protein